jgi:hypothetical protein
MVALEVDDAVAVTATDESVPGTGATQVVAADDITAVEYAAEAAASFAATVMVTSMLFASAVPKVVPLAGVAVTVYT